MVFSPIATWGPMIEFFMSHPSAILTGGIKMVFSKLLGSAMDPPNFCKRIELDFKRDSFLPQSNQFSTLKDLKVSPPVIIHSSASVRLNSSWLLIPLVIILERQPYNSFEFLIL